MTFAFVLRTLKRRWLILLAGMLVGALCGALFSLATPAQYKATTTLVVTPVVTNPITGALEDVNIRTEQEILKSEEVARRAADELGIGEEGAAQLRADVEVAAPQGSQIMEVTVSGQSPQDAVDGANAIAGGYLDLRRETASESTARYLEEVDQQIADLRTDESSSASDNLVERLLQQRSSVALSDSEPGRVIGSAALPTKPSGPGLLITAAGATMAGLLLGVCFAVLRERSDLLVRSADRLELEVGALTVISSSTADREYWTRLADEAIRLSRIDLEHEDVRILVHGVAPVSTEEAAKELLHAAQGILTDPGSGLRWSSASSDLEEIQHSAAARVQIILAGAYRSTLVQSARRSDVAVVAAAPHSSMSEVRDLVRALQECSQETVVALASKEAPASASPAEKKTSSDEESDRDDEEHHAEQTHMAKKDDMSAAGK